MNGPTLERLGGAVFTCALAGAASSALAQDMSQSPNFGSANLSAGFTPDPHVVELTAGGDIDASHLGERCAGKISAAPDYRINYTAAPGVALTIRVRSSTDTTLVVNTPAGAYGCSDDLGGGINPGLVYRTPTSGQYDIWVGAYGDQPASAQLRVTELE